MRFFFVGYISPLHKKKLMLCQRNIFIHCVLSTQHEGSIWKNRVYNYRKNFEILTLFKNANEYENPEGIQKNGRTLKNLGVVFTPIFLHTLFNTHPPFVFCAKKMFLTYKYYRFFGYPNLLHLT